jgi:hypothetical protein
VHLTHLTILEAGPFAHELLALCLAPHADTLLSLSLGCSADFVNVPDKTREEVRVELWEMLSSTKLLPNLRELRLRGLPAPLGPSFTLSLSRGLLRHRLTKLDLQNVESLPTPDCLTLLSSLQHLRLRFLNLKTASLPPLPHSSLLSLDTNADLAISHLPLSLSLCSSLRCLTLDRSGAHVARDRVTDDHLLSLWPTLTSLVSLSLSGFHHITPLSLSPLRIRRIPVDISLSRCPRVEHAVRPV